MCKLYRSDGSIGFFLGASGGRPVGRRGFIAAFGKGLEGRAAGSQRFLRFFKQEEGIERNTMELC